MEVDPWFELEVKERFTFTDPKTGRLHCEAVTVRLGLHDEEGNLHWIEATGGAQRVGVNSKGYTDGFAVEAKNAESDAIKRAAMRRGVALHMWEDLADSQFDEDFHPDYEEAQAAAPKGNGRPSTSTPPAPTRAAGIDTSAPQGSQAAADAFRAGQESVERARASQNATANADDPPATMRHLRYLLAMARNYPKIDGQQLDRVTQESFRVPAAQLTRGQANALIAQWKAPPYQEAPPQAAEVNGQPNPPRRSDEQNRKIWALVSDKGKNKEWLDEVIATSYQKLSSKELTVAEARAIIDMLQELPDKDAPPALDPADDYGLPPWDDIPF